MRKKLNWKRVTFLREKQKGLREYSGNTEQNWALIKSLVICTWLDSRTVRYQFLLCGSHFSAVLVPRLHPVCVCVLTWLLSLKDLKGVLWQLKICTCSDDIPNVNSDPDSLIQGDIWWFWVGQGKWMSFKWGKMWIIRSQMTYHFSLLNHGPKWAMFQGLDSTTVSHFWIWDGPGVTLRGRKWQKWHQVGTLWGLAVTTLGLLENFSDHIEVCLSGRREKWLGQKIERE